MIIYVKKPKYGGFVTPAQASAYQGFQEIGFDVETFETIDEVPRDEEVLLVSGLKETQEWLKSFNITYPLIDYPHELLSFLGRRIIKTTISELEFHLDGKRYFLKPFEEKQFPTSIIEYDEDLKKFKDIPENTQVWLSEFKQFDAEYRCYVRGKELLGCFKYLGNSCYNPNLSIAQEMINQYISSPKGYTLDFGITEKGEMLLIEVNDGFAIANYGLEDNKYALLLLSRWDELFS